MTTQLTREEIDQLKLIDDPNRIKEKVQERALKEWRANRYLGCLEMTTGAGKTRCAVLAAVEVLDKNPGAVVYIAVPTEPLRDRGWPDEFKLWGYESYLSKVNIICHASISKVQEPTKEIDLFIFDECHHVTPENTTAFYTHTVYRRLGLTATIPNGDYDVDIQKREIIDALFPPVFKVPLEQAIELNLVADFEVTVLKFDLDDIDPYLAGGTKRKPTKTTERKLYNHYTKMLQKATYTKNEKFKFVWIQKRTDLIYNLRSKTYLARMVMDKVLDGKRTLIFCGSIPQSEELCGKNVYNSMTNNSSLEDFQKLLIDYLGAVNALNEGANIELLDQILVLQLSSKELAIKQRLGRAIRWRPDHIGQVIVLVAKNTCDEKWYESAFQNFDRKRIKEYYVKVTKPAAAITG